MLVQCYNFINLQYIRYKHIKVSKHGKNYFICKKIMENKTFTGKLRNVWLLIWGCRIIATMLDTESICEWELYFIIDTLLNEYMSQFHDIVGINLRVIESYRPKSQRTLTCLWQVGMLYLDPLYFPHFYSSGKHYVSFEFQRIIKNLQLG